MIPAAILITHEFLCQLGNQVRLLTRRAAIRSGFGLAVFDALHQAAHPNLEKLVEVPRSDCQELARAPAVGYVDFLLPRAHDG